MREAELRTVLLVRAIEEADRAGTLIPAADRVAAAREARRELGDAPPDRLLAARARALFQRISQRRPFVASIRELAPGPWWLVFALVVLGVLAGMALSALDGTRRINVLAFPLLGLIAWNLVVYAIVIARALRPGAMTAPRIGPLTSVFTQSIAARVMRLISRSRNFDTQMADALTAFVRDWTGLVKPWLAWRAARALHLAAAGVGVGLVAGLYARGIAFDYQAGWASTFLDAHGAHRLVSILYGPASWLTGIELPTVARMEAIRWTTGTAIGGENAARWIHLVAASALLFVVLPRVAIALVDSVFIARWSRQAPVPSGLAPYTRQAFSGTGGVDRGIAVVLPYAYEPTSEALERLRALLVRDFGEHLAIDVRPAIAYGDEATIARNLEQGAGELADAAVILLNLAATPEEENHGKALESIRDWLAQHRPHTRVAVLVDEGGYAERMGAGDRLEERRGAWRGFVTARGMEPRLVDLSK